MADYRVRFSSTLNTEMHDWTVATNATPALGGAVLVAMLQLMGDRPQEGWTPQELEHLIRVQQAVLEFRFEHMDGSEDLPAAVQQLLEQAAVRDLHSFMLSPSTVHASPSESTDE